MLSWPFFNPNKWGMHMRKLSPWRLGALLLATSLAGPATAQVLSLGSDPNAVIYGAVRFRNLAPSSSGPSGAAEIQLYSGPSTLLGELQVTWTGSSDGANIRYDGTNLSVLKSGFTTGSISRALTISGPPINYFEYRVTKNSPSTSVIVNSSVFGNPQGTGPFSNVNVGVSGGTNSSAWMLSGKEWPQGFIIGAGLSVVGLVGGGDANYIEVRFGYVPPPDSQAPVVSSITTQPVPALLNGQVTVTANVSDETTGGNNITSAQYSLNDGAWQAMNAQDGSFSGASEDVTASFYATTLGENKVCVRGSDALGNTASPVCQTFIVTYKFTGFFSPVDNDPAVNVVKAGQAVPVKWRITDANDAPISDTTSFDSLQSYAVSCTDFSGSPDDALEEVAAGSSGLQYSGDGYWQFNWKTAANYASTCRALMLEFKGGALSPTVKFKFKK